MNISAGMTYDLLILLIIALSAINAMKKGFAYTLVNFAGYLVSMILAFVISNPLSKMICAKFVSPIVSQKLAENISAAGSDIALGISKYIDSMPDFLHQIFSLENLGGVTPSNIAVNTAESIIVSAAASALSVLLFIIIFSLLLFLVRRFANATKFIKRVPIVGTVNKILGAVMGAMRGFIVAYLFFCVISLLSLLIGTSVDILSYKIMETSYMFRLFNTITMSII